MKITALSKVLPGYDDINICLIADCHSLNNSFMPIQNSTARRRICAALYINTEELPIFCIPESLLQWLLTNAYGLPCSSLQFQSLGQSLEQ